MEMYARWVHRALWHDTPSGWRIHKSHHEPRAGAFEANDVYALANALNIVVEHALRNGKGTPAGFGVTIRVSHLVEHPAILAGLRSEAGAWVRMNPVDGKGVSDMNVTAFRFALLEFDTIPMDLQLSLVASIPLPISAVITSGGRSVHAWIRVDQPSAEDYRNRVREMLLLLEKYGVDQANKNPSRLSRLPGVRRTLGRQGDGRQRLLYLNPCPRTFPILNP